MIHFQRSPRTAGWALAILLVSLAPLAGAQETSQESSPQMDRMAEAMTAMAETCQDMMQREQQAMPYKIAAVCILGALLTIAIVLFIVLEVQWIRWYSWRIRDPRSKLP